MIKMSLAGAVHVPEMIDAKPPVVMFLNCAWKLLSEKVPAARKLTVPKLNAFAPPTCHAIPSRNAMILLPATSMSGLPAPNPKPVLLSPILRNAPLKVIAPAGGVTSMAIK